MLKLAQLSNILISSQIQTLPSSLSYSLEPLQPRHKPQLIQFCVRQFGNQYPLTLAFCRYDPTETGEQLQGRFWKNIVDHFIQSGLSVVAIDRKQNKIVAVLLAMDFIKYHEFDVSNSEEQFYEKSLNALKDSLLNKLDHSLLNQMSTPGTCAELFALAVAPSHSGKGIMQKMVEEVLGLARNKEYRYAFMHPTSAISEHICRKFDFELLEDARSDLFQLEGERPFRLVEEKHRRATLYLKSIQ